MYTNVLISGQTIVDEVEARRKDCLFLQDVHFLRCAWWCVDEYLDRLLEHYEIKTERDLQTAIDEGALQACIIILRGRPLRPDLIEDVVIAFLRVSVDPRERRIAPNAHYKPGNDDEFLKLVALVLIEFGNFRGFLNPRPPNPEV